MKVLKDPAGNAMFSDWNDSVKKSCFSVYTQVAIQAIGTDSDIGTETESIKQPC